MRAVARARAARAGGPGCPAARAGLSRSRPYPSVPGLPVPVTSRQAATSHARPAQKAPGGKWGSLRFVRIKEIIDTTRTCVFSGTGMALVACLVVM